MTVCGRDDNDIVLRVSTTAVTPITIIRAAPNPDTEDADSPTSVTIIVSAGDSLPLTLGDIIVFGASLFAVMPLCLSLCLFTFVRLRLRFCSHELT